MTKWPTKLTDLIVELPIIEDATCDAMVDWFEQNKARPVSYTHLTLPTNSSV